MTRLSLVACTLENLRDLTEISRDTFMAAFEDQNNPEDFQNYIQKAFTSEQIRKELNHPDSYFYFVYTKGISGPATNNQELVGYIKLNAGLAQTELKEDTGIELERIYIVSDHQNKGYGSQVLELSLDIARQMKKQYIWLGVWEKNPGAIAFYQRFGFTIFGEHAFYIGSDRQLDKMMRLDL